MALVVADRVKETTLSTGTGTISLTGPVAGFQTFVAGVGSTNTTYYAITDSATGDWEVGIGTVTSGSPDTLSRDTVLESSNSDNLVNFGAGQKIVICTQPAEKAVYLNAAGDLDVAGDIDMGTNTITDTKVGQWDTAYGWGDHGAEGYLTGNQTITLSGDVSGSGSTSITVTIADDSHNHIISNVDGLQTALDAKVAKAGDTMTGFLTLHAAPTSDLHAATKAYVDEVAQGIVTRPSVDAATTANLSGTYDNGTAGVGATLNLGSAATLTIDDVSITSLYQGILVKNQSTAAHNGRYFVSQVGGASTDWILTRCGYCDTADEIPGSYIFVTDGTVNANTGWIQTVADPATFTVGTDAITVVQFSGAGTYTAGTGLDLTGTVFSHTDTSSQASVNNSNGTVIQDITLDTFGHITAIGSADLDGRYYTETEVGNFFSGSTAITGYNKTNWDTAYGWGNHASAGYQAAATALTTSTTFGGDVSGTYNAIVVADDSHNHIISNVDGLQTALDSKQAAATALTTSTTFGGDVSGTYNAIVVANDSHTHDTRYYTETEVGSLFAGTTAITGYNKTNWDTAYGWGNHASQGYLTGNQTITLSGDVSGSGTTSISVTVADDSHNHIISNVDGLQTALDAKLALAGGTMTGDLKISKADAAIYLNDSSGSPTQQGMRIRAESIDSNLPNSEGIGIIFEEDPANGSPDTTPAVITTGEFYAQSNSKVFHDGYHPNADKWTTARTLTLNGDVSGSVSIDGSANVTLTTTVADNSHNHNYVSEGGTSFSGTYPVVVRTSANTIYTDGTEITFNGTTNGLTVSGRVDSPIFYDSNNTGYYGDFASTSSLNALNITSSVQMNSAPTYFSDYDRNAGSANFYPNAWARGVKWSFASSASAGTGGNYAGVLHFHPYDGTTASTGDASYQLAFGSTGTNLNGNPQLAIRNGIDTTWGSWRYIPMYGLNQYTSSFYATIFYDSNNTGYYVDPASTSLLNDVRVNAIQSGTTSDLSSMGQIGIYSSGSPYISFHAGTTARTAYFQETGGRFLLAEVTYTESVGSFRAPLFYDVDNTAYYADPASISNFYTVQAQDAFRSDRYECLDGTFLFRVGSTSGATRHINLSDGTGDPSAAAPTNAITWGQRTDSNPYYMIHLRGQYNNGYSNHTRLSLAWHTGIEIGASSTYGGTRFFNNSPAISGAAEIMRVGSGNNDVFINNIGYAGASLRSPIFYDYNDTNFYVDPASTSRIRKTNLIASGTGWDDCLNLYSSDATNRWNILVDNGAADAFRIAYNNSEALQINTSRNVTAIVDVRSPIFYDSNSTAYFADLASSTTAIKANGAIVLRSGSTDWDLDGTEEYGTSFPGDYDTAEHPNEVKLATLNPGLIKNERGNALLWFNKGDGISAYFGKDSGMYGLVALKYAQADSNDAHVFSGDLSKVSGAYMYDGNRHAWWNNSGLGTSVDDTALTGDAKMELDSDGILSAIAFQAVSDERLKDNVKKISISAKDLKQVSAYEYNFKASPQNTHIGVLAQEVEKIIPHVVTDKESGYKVADYHGITAALISVINELTERVEILEQLINKR